MNNKVIESYLAEINTMVAANGDLVYDPDIEGGNVCEFADAPVVIYSEELNALTDEGRSLAYAVRKSKAALAAFNRIRFILEGASVFSPYASERKLAEKLSDELAEFVWA
jgi:hypothetical protein